MAKKILSKTLSFDSELLFNELEQSFMKSIVFYPIAELPHYDNINSYGAVDTFSPGPYKVWLKEDLPFSAFEANMFHELHHIWQIENAFPAVENKPTDLFQSSDMLFFEEVGSHIQSVILDIDVYNWLNANGYSSKFFINERYEGFIQNKDLEYNMLHDKYNFANLVSAFTLFFVFASPDQISHFKTAYIKYPSVLSTSEELAKVIDSINPVNPQSSALGMCLLIDRLNLWDTYYVRINDQKIRTAKQFKSFESAYIPV